MTNSRPTIPVKYIKLTADEISNSLPSVFDDGLYRYKISTLLRTSHFSFNDADGDSLAAIRFDSGMNERSPVHRSSLDVGINFNAIDFSGKHTFHLTYRVYDGTSWSQDVGRIDVVVNGINDIPTIADSTTERSVTEGSNAEIADDFYRFRRSDFSFADKDYDHFWHDAVRIISIPDGVTLLRTNGVIVEENEVIRSSELSSVLINTPDTDASARYDFQYQVSDGIAWSNGAPGTFTLVVNGVRNTQGEEEDGPVNNFPTIPVSTTNESYTESEDNVYALPFRFFSYADTEAGQSEVHSIRITEMSPGLKLIETFDGDPVGLYHTTRPTDPKIGVLAPDKSTNATYTLKYQVFDGEDWSEDVGTINLTIIGVDDSSEIVSAPDGTINAASRYTSVSKRVLASDDSLVLPVRITGDDLQDDGTVARDGVTYGTFTYNSQGEWTFEASLDALRKMPAPTSSVAPRPGVTNAEKRFTFNVETIGRDENKQPLDTDSFTVTLLGANDAPEMDPIAGAVINIPDEEGATATATGAINATDVDGERLTYKITGPDIQGPIQVVENGEASSSSSMVTRKGITYGTLSITQSESGSHSWRFTTDPSQATKSEIAKKGGKVDFTFTARVFDVGYMSTEDFTVSLVNGNARPTITSVSNATATFDDARPEQVSVSGDITVTDTDSSVPSIKARIATAGVQLQGRSVIKDGVNYGKFVIGDPVMATASSGTFTYTYSWTYTPSFHATRLLVDDQQEVFTFKVLASDGDLDSSEEDIVVTLLGHGTGEFVDREQAYLDPITIHENFPLIDPIYQFEQPEGTVGKWYLFYGDSRGPLPDTRLFWIDTEGKLWLRRSPDYDNPADADGDNTYLIQARFYASEPEYTQYAFELQINVTDLENEVDSDWAKPANAAKLREENEKRFVKFDIENINPADLPEGIPQHLLAGFAWDMPEKGPLVLTWGLVRREPKAGAADEYAYRSVYDRHTALRTLPEIQDARNMVNDALALFEAVVNIKFVEVRNDGNKQADISFLFSETSEVLGGKYYYQGGVVGPTRVEVGHIGRPAMDAGTLPGLLGGTPFATLLHEIGHTLGLKHPYQGWYDPLGFPSNTAYLESTESVMSRNHEARWTDGFRDADIQALQFLYGEPGANTRGVKQLIASGPLETTLLEEGLDLTTGEGTPLIVGDPNASGKVGIRKEQKDQERPPTFKVAKLGDQEFTEGNDTENNGKGASVDGFYGTLFLKEDGSWTYDLDNARTETDSLRYGDRAQDFFVFRAQDEDEATDSLNLLVKINVAGFNEDSLPMPEPTRNDSPPTFKNGYVSVAHIAENNTGFNNNTTVLFDEPASPHLPGATMSYELAGEDASLFSVNPSTGEVRFRSNERIDYEDSDAENGLFVFDLVAKAAHRTGTERATKHLFVQIKDTSELGINSHNALYANIDESGEDVRDAEGEWQSQLQLDIV